MSEFLLGIVSGGVGALVGLLTARKLWYVGSAEKQQMADKQEKADDDEADRLIKLLKDHNELALAAAKLEYEVMLHKEVEKAKREIRGEMESKLDAILDIYGCDLAPDCDSHKPRKRPIRGF